MAKGSSAPTNQKPPSEYTYVVSQVVVDRLIADWASQTAGMFNNSRFIYRSVLHSWIYELVRGVSRILWERAARRQVRINDCMARCN